LVSDNQHPLPNRAQPKLGIRVPGCRRALRCLGAQLLCRRCQADGLEPVRSPQRNLHHQLLRSGL